MPSLMPASNVFSFLTIGQIRAPALAEVLDTSIAGFAWRRIERKPPADLLERFCRIADSDDTDAAVEAFARRWGLLGLCEHGLPHLCEGHTVVRGSITPCGWTGVESFDHWKRLALASDSMLRIGLALNRGKPGDQNDWELAASGICGDAGEELLGDWWAEGIAPRLNDDEITRRTTKGLRVARIDYAILMRRLIDISHLQPMFETSGRNWNIEMGSTQSMSNIPAILTAQLILRVGSSGKQIKCSACHRWFIPRRNQRKYCDRCGIRAAWRAANRKRRG